MNQEQLQKILDQHFQCIANTASSVSGLVVLYDGLVERVNQLEALLAAAKIRDEEFAAQLRGQK